MLLLIAFCLAMYLENGRNPHLGYTPKQGEKNAKRNEQHAETRGFKKKQQMNYCRKK